MQNTLPEVGKTYKSEVEPDLIIYVEDITTIDGEEGDPDGHLIEGCPPDGRDDMSAMGYEFLHDEWIAHKFTPYTI